MKTVKYIYLMLLPLMILSCKIESGNGNHIKRTLSGKLVYENTSNMLGEHLVTFNFLQSVDLYINTTDAVEKDNIKNLLLKEYQIETTEDGVYTLNGARVWRIKTTNKSLNETGVSWSVSCKYSGYDSEERVIISVDGFVAKCTAPEKWSLSIDSFKDEFSTGVAALTVERIKKRAQSNYIDSDYSIAGKGHIFYKKDDRIMDIDYATLLPVIYIADPEYGNRPNIPSPQRVFWFSDGITDMTVTNSTNSTPEAVKADLTASIENDLKVKITFKGITETWDRFEWSY